MSKPDTYPSAAYVGRLRAWLAIHKVPPQDANELVRMAKTLRQIGDDIAAYMRAK